MDLSIIIPVARRENDFKLIKQLREKFKGCEIIIVCDETNEVIKSAKLQVDQFHLLKNSSRAKALNKGANLSNRKNLWFLHLDSNIEHIQLSDLTGLDEFTVSTFLLEFDQTNCWWIAAGANFRTKTFGIPFGDQSFLMSKKLFNFAGGFDENLSLGEDHEFIWRIKSLNIKLNIINKKIITSAIKYENKKIYQSLKTLWKTILQAIKFYQEKKTIVLGVFLKDPRSIESKSRLRKILNDFERRGTVIDVKEIIDLGPFNIPDKPITKLTTKIKIKEKDTGTFNSSTFEGPFEEDLKKAKKYTVIFSAFLTEKRVAT